MEMLCSNGYQNVQQAEGEEASVNHFTAAKELQELVAEHWSSCLKQQWSWVRTELMAPVCLSRCKKIFIFLPVVFLRSVFSQPIGAT
ncbi:hypothetical protein Y1Q_0009712 [Alligator mississippiensis]|uniref:Uncharacterized protein n=1 Tax=Alligator mississippiensis TaxID=8496 RepID=A0A151MWJ1_ALLMI|nr:hypothetical protein Y1Q_0009712 [Alligator mississippiensis]